MTILFRIKYIGFSVSVISPKTFLLLTKEWVLTAIIALLGIIGNLLMTKGKLFMTGKYTHVMHDPRVKTLLRLKASGHIGMA
jgi:hypothetical protein